VGALKTSEQKIQGVHVGTLTDIDYVLVLNQGTEYLKKGSKIKKLGTYIQFLVVSNASVVNFLVLLNPTFIALLDSIR
jgi:hypothetical protein